jgi:hypothetical protein
MADTDTKADPSGLTGKALELYKKLCAKGVKPAVAKMMATRAAAKMTDSTDTSRVLAAIDLSAVPDNLKQGARDDAADKGEAMPGGRFPIRNLGEVGKAIEAFSLAKGDKSSIKRFILKRAKALGAGQDVLDKINALDDGDDDESDSDQSDSSSSDNSSDDSDD